jgi:hypothetical protein
MRVHAADKAAWTTKARAAGLSLSAWIASLANSTPHLRRSRAADARSRGNELLVYIGQEIEASKVALAQKDLSSDEIAGINARLDGIWIVLEELVAPGNDRSDVLPPTET